MDIFCSREQKVSTWTEYVSKVEKCKGEDFDNDGFGSKFLGYFRELEDSADLEDVED